MRILMIFISLMQISSAIAESPVTFTHAISTTDSKFDYSWNYMYLTNSERTFTARVACWGYLDISKRYLSITVVPGREFDFRHSQRKEVSVDKGSQEECVKAYLALKDISPEKPFVFNPGQTLVY